MKIFMFVHFLDYYYPAIGRCNNYFFGIVFEQADRTTEKFTISK